MATGISVSDTSNLTTGQKIMVAAARDANEPAAPDPDLVGQTNLPQGHKQYDLETFARFSTANPLTEGVDLAQSEQFVTNAVTITPSEHGVIATISKYLIRRQGDTNISAKAGTMLGASLRRRLALDIIALYDGVTGKSTPGTTNSLDITTFRGSIAYLLTDNDSAYGPAELPVHAALHIEQISDIIVDITDSGPRGTTTGFTGDLIKRWWRGNDRLYGIPVFHSGNIARDSSNDSKGCIFAPSAFHLVIATDVDVTEQWDYSARLVERGVFQEWSEAEIVDVHAVEIYSNSSSTI